MLPKIPMLATATDWRGWISSPANTWRLLTITGACATKSTLRPNDVSRACRSARSDASSASSVGASRMNWVIEANSEAESWMMIPTTIPTIAT